MTLSPEQIARRTRLEMKAGRKAVRAAKKKLELLAKGICPAGMPRAEFRQHMRARREEQKEIERMRKWADRLQMQERFGRGWFKRYRRKLRSSRQPKAEPLPAETPPGGSGG